MFRFTAKEDLSPFCSNRFYISLFYDNNIYFPFVLSASGVLGRYQYSAPLNPVVVKTIKLIYGDVTSNNLLGRCVGGFTQNVNESFKNVLCRVALKVTHSGININDIAANVLAASFNVGNRVYLQIMESLGIAIV